MHLCTVVRIMIYLSLSLSYLFKFCQINDSILEVVQDRDIITRKANRKLYVVYEVAGNLNCHVKNEGLCNATGSGKMVISPKRCKAARGTLLKTTNRITPKPLERICQTFNTWLP